LKNIADKTARARQHKKSKEKNSKNQDLNSNIVVGTFENLIGFNTLYYVFTSRKLYRNGFNMDLLCRIVRQSSWQINPYPSRIWLSIKICEYIVKLRYVA